MRIDRDGVWFLAALALLVLTAFVTWFFRDPDREPPADRQVVLSPADGRILAVRDRRISVFMNVFDVHVCRAPVAGTVLGVRHTPGRFRAAFRDDATECNERVEIEIASADGPVRFTLVAGLIARRIVCRIVPGESLVAGQRVGLIRVGWRVGVDLPPGLEPGVAGRSFVARRRPAGPPGTFPL